MKNITLLCLILFLPVILFAKDEKRESVYMIAHSIMLEALKSSATDQTSFFALYSIQKLNDAYNELYTTLNVDNKLSLKKHYWSLFDKNIDGILLNCTKYSKYCDTLVAAITTANDFQLGFKLCKSGQLKSIFCINFAFLMGEKDEVDSFGERFCNATAGSGCVMLGRVYCKLNEKKKAKDAIINALNYVNRERVKEIAEFKMKKPGSKILPSPPAKSHNDFELGCLKSDPVFNQLPYMFLPN